MKNNSNLYLPIDPNRNSTSRSLHQRPLQPHSPRLGSSFHFEGPHSPRNMGDQMRFLKSRIEGGNTTMNSFNKVGENNLFPTQLLFLLKNEEGNVAHMRKVVEDEKERVERDFKIFSQEIVHQIQDMKLSVNSQIEAVYKDFLGFYRDLKSRVSQLRETRRVILMNYPNNDYQQHSKAYSPAPHHNASNLNFLQELSRDEEYFKNHRMYEEITSAHSEAMGPIMSIVQNLIAIGGQGQLYNNEKTSEVLRDMRDRFYRGNQEVYERQLQQMVISTNQILEDSNALLKQLNIDDRASDRNGSQVHVPTQANHSSQVHALPRAKSHSNLMISPIGEKRVQAESDSDIGALSPYGLPTFKDNYKLEHNRQQQSRSNAVGPASNKYSRPSSSNSDYHGKYNGRNNLKGMNPASNRSADDYNYQIIKAKPNPIKVTRDQQNAVLEAADNIRLVSEPKGMMHQIGCQEAHDIILCAVFVNSGKNIVLGSKDRSIYVYSTSNGANVAHLHGHQASVCSLGNFGEFLASGGDNGCGSLIIWSIAEWKSKNRVSLHSAALTCILDVLDGKHLATAGYDKKITLYNYKSSEIKLEINANKSPITSMVLCAQGSRLVTAGLDSILNCWSLIIQNGTIEDIRLQNSIKDCGLVSILRPLTLSPQYILAGTREGKLLLINSASGQVAKVLPVGSATVLELVVLERENRPDSPLIISSCSNEKSLVLTKMDSNISFPLGIDGPINISYGCGIGPKMIIDGSSALGIVSQSQLLKQVRIYSIQKIFNYS